MQQGILRYLMNVSTICMTYLMFLGLYGRIFASGLMLNSSCTCCAPQAANIHN